MEAAAQAGARRKMIIVDAHEDLAWNMMTYGRDYTRSVSKTRAHEAGGSTIIYNGNTMLGWPDWLEGQVALVFATLFATPIRYRLNPQVQNSYANSQEANQVYRAQLDIYHRLVEEHADKFRLITNVADLDSHLERWVTGDAEKRQLGLLLLMEGSDAIVDPSELEEWAAGGLRIVGLAWSRTRHSGGTYEPGPLTDEGRKLLEVMADLDLILDISHMTEEATLQALEGYGGVVIASHSNAGALLHGSSRPERHLSDLVIRELAQRGGVIGVVLYNKFLIADWHEGTPRSAVSIEYVVDQIDYMCQLVGSAAHVGIGSDFDGGFGLEESPTGIESIADLQLIGDALRVKGYSLSEVEAVLGSNWINLLRRGLPEN